MRAAAKSPSTRRPTAQRERVAPTAGSLAIHRAAHGPQSVQVGQTWSDLSAVQQRLRDWEGAARSAQRAAVLLARHYGRENPRYAMALANLATVRTEQQRYPEAVALLEEVVRIDRQSFGAASPRETGHRNSLGWAYLQLKRLDEAERQFELAHAAAVRAQGPDHTDAAWPLRGLAAVEIERGRPQAALRHVERSLALRRRVHGPIHWEIAMSYNDLAEVAVLERDLEAEEGYRRRALEISRQVYKADHPDLALAAAQLGEVLCKQGGSDRAEGRALLTEAIGLRRAAGAAQADLAGWRRSQERCGAG